VDGEKWTEFGQKNHQYYDHAEFGLSSCGVLPSDPIHGTLALKCDIQSARLPESPVFGFVGDLSPRAGFTGRAKKAKLPVLTRGERFSGRECLKPVFCRRCSVIH
jgi:hypothetical protein